MRLDSGRRMVESLLPAAFGSLCSIRSSRRFPMFPAVSRRFFSYPNVSG